MATFCPLTLARQARPMMVDPEMERKLYNYARKKDRVLCDNAPLGVITRFTAADAARFFQYHPGDIRADAQVKPLLPSELSDCVWQVRAHHTPLLIFGA